MEKTADGIFKNEEDVAHVIGTETLGAPRRKQGHKFCGGCCDVRRATIVVDIIAVCLNTLALLALIGFYITIADQYQYTDDQIQQKVVTFPSFALSLVWFLICIAIFSCGIYGAIKYNIWLVGMALVLHSVECVMALIELRIVAVVMAALFAYPHVFYIMEVRKGTMSQENCHNEEHSCCCV